VHFNTINKICLLEYEIAMTTVVANTNGDLAIPYSFKKKYYLHMKSMDKKSTGERLEFYDFSDVTVEHLHRYALANDFVSGKVVLDIASGEGYGSYILSNNALEVIGVDIDIDSIKNAKEKYSKNNLKFIVGSADSIPVESNSIDVVVSFETIEHHDKHEEMFLEIKRVLKKEGVLIISSPDKKYYSDIPNFKNKFHVKELYFEEFKGLVEKKFKNTKFLFQKAYNFNSFIAPSNNYLKTIVYTGDYNALAKEISIPLYNIAICSDDYIDEILPSIFNGKQISDLQNATVLTRMLEHHKNRIYNTNSYKFGNLILSPLFLLKKILKKVTFK
jgi:ubiquinone/menaquinone biosynthesis C-methylase UbiE